MYPKWKSLFFTSFVLAVQLPICQIARAGAELSLSDGTSSVLILDNGLGDADPKLGSIRFAGTVGDFTGTFGTGTTKPFNGTATQPELSFTSTGITSGLGGTLTILFGDTDFGPVPNGTVNAHIGGVTADLGFQLPAGAPTVAGQVAFRTFMDANNLSLGLATPLTSQGILSGATFDANFNGTASFGASTSLTEQIVISQGPHALTGFNSTLRITNPVRAPETGSSAVLLTAALLALAVFRKFCRETVPVPTP